MTGLLLTTAGCETPISTAGSATVILEYEEKLREANQKIAILEPLVVELKNATDETTKLKSELTSCKDELEKLTLVNQQLSKEILGLKQEKTEIKNHRDQLQSRVEQAIDVLQPPLPKNQNSFESDDNSE